MASELTSWALPRLEKLLPLDQDSLKQIIDYAESLPKEGAAEHLKNLLGDSPQSLEFISSFNSRRKTAPTTTSPSRPASRPNSRQPSPPEDVIPRSRPRQAKKKQNIHSLPARRIEDHGEMSGAYLKKDVDDYMPTAARQKASKSTGTSTTTALSQTPEIAPRQPTAVDTFASAGGHTTLAVPTSSSAPASTSASASPSRTPKSSRQASPAPPPSPKPSTATSKTTVKITGGAAMHGASTATSDLDAAIRALEIQTNPTLTTSSSSASPEDAAADRARRACPCMATRHPLLAVAPNCLACGNIVCVKQGLGPCTSCGAPLMSAQEIQAVLRVLKDERGRERQAAGNAANKRADVAGKPKPFSGRDFLSSAAAASSGRSSPLSGAASSREVSPGPTPAELLASASAAAGAGPVLDEEEEKLARAREHRDKLLSFQSQNARRTRIHDEAADYAVPVTGGDGRLRGNIWASPAERAMELKKQQRVLREMEFNARPEWERKREVASIDVVKGKVVRRFVERKFGEEGSGGNADGRQQEGEEVDEDVSGEKQGDGGDGRGAGQGGAFSNNPLLGKLIRPKYASGDGLGHDGERRKAKSTWRRVQDDLDDNEDVILDGGTRGFRGGDGVEVA